MYKIMKNDFDQITTILQKYVYEVKIMKKRIISMMLAAIVLLGTFSLGACKKDPLAEDPSVTDPSDDTTTAPPEVPPAPEPTEFTLMRADGTTEFKIIRSNVSDAYTKNLVTELQQTVNTACGSNLAVGTDWARKADLNEDGTYSGNAFEIVVGNTNRKETAMAKEMLGADADYVIAAINNKLVIVGKTRSELTKAVEVFVKKVNEKKGTDWVIQKGEKLLGKGNATVLERVEGTDYRVMTFNVSLSNNEPLARYPHIQQIIINYSPDIIGFQEFNKAQHQNTMETLMKDNYDVNWEKHNDGTYNYTPIAYRKDKFEQIDGGVEWLDSRYTGTNTKCISWVVLKDRATEQKLMAVNFHGAIVSTSYEGLENLTGPEITELTKEWTEDNVRQILDIEARLKAAHGDIPLLVLGDYNFGKQSSAYKKLTEEAGLTEAEISSTGAKVTGWSTCFEFGTTPYKGNSIDHICYRPEQITALMHHIAMTEECELKASDHLAVFADIVIKKPS